MNDYYFPNPLIKGVPKKSIEKEIESRYSASITKSYKYPRNEVNYPDQDESDKLEFNLKLVNAQLFDINLQKIITSYATPATHPSIRKNLDWHKDITNRLNRKSIKNSCLKPSNKISTTLINSQNTYTENSFGYENSISNSLEKAKFAISSIQNLGIKKESRSRNIRLKSPIKLDYSRIVRTELSLNNTNHNYSNTFMNKQLKFNDSIETSRSKQSPRLKFLPTDYSYLKSTLPKSIGSQIKSSHLFEKINARISNISSKKF